jgi:hypothetical protein
MRSLPWRERTRPIATPSAVASSASSAAMRTRAAGTKILPFENVAMSVSG